MEYDNYRAAMEMITEIFDIETVKWERRKPFPLAFCMQLFLRHIVEKDAFAQQRIVSVMLTDVKENGAVVFLGKLYNIIPGKKPFTRAFNSAPSAFSYTAVELPPYFSGNCPFICRIFPIVLLA